MESKKIALIIFSFIIILFSVLNNVCHADDKDVDQFWEDFDQNTCQCIPKEKCNQGKDFGDETEEKHDQSRDKLCNQIVEEVKKNQTKGENDKIPNEQVICCVRVGKQENQNEFYSNYGNYSN